MDNKRLLSELTTEEAEALFYKNSKLRELASEQAQESESFWLDEYLQPFQNIRGLSYNIGYPATFMTVRESAYKDFLEAADNAQAMFCLFNPETAAKLERAAARIDLYDEASAGYYDMSDKQFEKLEKWLANIIESAAAELVTRLAEELEISYTEEAAKEALEILLENIGDQYETDEVYIYETTVRKYA